MKKYIASVLIALTACAAPIAPAFGKKDTKPPAAQSAPKQECTPPPPEFTAENGTHYRTIAQGVADRNGAMCVLVGATNDKVFPGVVCLFLGCRDSCNADWVAVDKSETCLELSPLQGTVSL